MTKLIIIGIFLGMFVTFGILEAIAYLIEVGRKKERKEVKDGRKKI